MLTGQTLCEGAGSPLVEGLASSKQKKASIKLAFNQWRQAESNRYLNFTVFTSDLISFIVAS
jgi:hypothetical protein